MSEKLKLCTARVPVFRKRRWWQLWKPQWVKIGTEAKTFSVVPGAEASAPDPGLIYLEDGGRSGFFTLDGPLKPEWFGAVADPPRAEK